MDTKLHVLLLPKSTHITGSGSTIILAALLSISKKSVDLGAWVKVNTPLLVCVCVCVCVKLARLRRLKPNEGNKTICVI